MLDPLGHSNHGVKYFELWRKLIGGYEPVNVCIKDFLSAYKSTVVCYKLIIYSSFLFMLVNN